MLAGVYRRPGEFGLSLVPDPGIHHPGDVIMAIKAAGLCKTDYHITSNPQLHPARDNIVLGHECVGEILDVGSDVRGLRRGDLVVLSPNIWCLHCDNCQRGFTNICQNEPMDVVGITRDGGFAPYLAVPERICTRLPEGLAIENAVFAEPLHCVVDSLLEAGSVLGQTVLVMGCGPIGAYFVRLLQHLGANSIIVSEVLEVRKKLATRLGVDLIVDPLEGDLAAQIHDHRVRDIDLVIDTTGVLLDQALPLVRRGGTVLVFGLDQGARISISPFDIARNKKRIIGGFANPMMMGRCLKLLQQIDFTDLISQRYNLMQISQALQSVAENSTLKTIVFPQA